MVRVPRGVVDARGRHAVVHDHEGALMALDLETGALLWRHGPGLRPCALLAGSVVALRSSPSPTLVVVVLDAETGEVRWTSEPADLPPWARFTLDDTRGFTLRTETDENAVVIRWVARTWYGGGAAPSVRVLEESRREAHGALRVDPAGPPVEVLPEAEVLPEPADVDAPALLPPAAPQPSPDPDVLDQSQVGDMRVELTLRPDSGAVVLRAVDLRTAAVKWEVELDRATTRRAPKLPP
ncbi:MULTISPECIES: PQQ-binding-like beta-propeller repeat protein [unclassified Streptomyces]|uniref:outer membrane protein assembly factor BamB family protein n=1 Tax=unclassified Streptomyces TaxID=2593676 RepID=UPI00339E87D4